MRIQVVTLRFSPTLGAFDATPLAEFVRDKELIAFREQFFCVQEIPHLLCVITWRWPDAGEAAAAAALPSSAATATHNGAAAPAPTAPAPSAAIAGLSEADRVLFQAFREWRARRATKDGVARWLVLTDAQVRNLIRVKPANVTALAQIAGIGKGKLERYGAEILKVLHGVAPQRPAPPAAPAPVAPATTNGAAPPAPAGNGTAPSAVQKAPPGEAPPGNTAGGNGAAAAGSAP